MSTDFFTQMTERRTEAIAALDASTFAPSIRNHLVQLFRAAHAKDSALEGVKAAMGSAWVPGQYLDSGDPTADHPDDKPARLRDASQYEVDDDAQYQPQHPETRAFLEAVDEYSDLLCNGRGNDLPYIGDITSADLTTTRAKKAERWGPKGTRARQ